MSKTKALWVFACGTSIALLSEIVYYCFQHWQKRLSLARATSSKVVFEVLWTNELSVECVKDANEVLNENINFNDNTMELLQYLNHQLCSNRFCSLRNLSRIIELIDSCQYCVDIAMYIFTSCKLRFALERAAKRGITVRVLLDKEMLEANGSQFKNLKICGIAVRFNTGTKLMHHKFCLLDSALRIESLYKEHNLILKEEFPSSSVVTGSLNWTVKGMNSNWENTLILSCKEVEDLYSMEFERMWLAFDNKLHNTKRIS